MTPERNIKLLIEYDGTNYAGWQYQENAVTVQERIESALFQVLQEKVRIAGAGRTDAGVHARGQVANFHTHSSIDAYELRGSMNSLLRNDVIVHAVEEVPPEFHARHSAREREYSYTISRQPTALMRFFTWYVRYDLNIPSMSDVARMIPGVHDFRSFCKTHTGTEDFVCNVSSAEWKEVGPLLVFTIRADRFLHGMVRTLVGTMVDIGRGYTPPEDFVCVLDRKDRREAGMAAPAKGLVLERVIY